MEGDGIIKEPFQSGVGISDDNTILTDELTINSGILKISRDGSIEPSEVSDSGSHRLGHYSEKYAKQLKYYVKKKIVRLNKVTMQSHAN